ncbi:MAG: hypothetical protein ACRD0P_22355 [Stackebrandtia sp.]
MPLSDAMFSGDLVRRIESLERQLREITSGRRLEDASVGARGIRMVGSSLTVVDPVIGQTVVRLGIDPATGDVGLVITDPDTGRNVSLSTIAFGMRTDVIEGSDIPSTSRYDDMSPVGPRVTVRVGSTRTVRVNLGATFAGTDSTATRSVALMGFALSGAMERGATDHNAISVNIDGFESASVGREFVMEDINPGLVTITAKYKASAGAAIRIYNRTLSAQPY